MPDPPRRRHILYKPPGLDEQTMTSLSRVGIAGVLAAVAAAVVYLAAFSGDRGEPAGNGASAAGQARAERLFAGLKNSERFAASGGSVAWESAEALDGEGVLVRKLRIEGKDPDGRPSAVAADELRVLRIDWNDIEMSPYGDVEIVGLTASNETISAFAAAAGAAAFVADLKARWDYKADGRIADLQTFDLAVREWGTFRLQARLHGLDLSALREIQRAGETDPAYALGLMAGTKIGGLSLSFEDGGAIDKLAGKRAELSGSDKEQVIEQALQGLEIQKAAQPHAIGRQIFDALIQFVRKRSTIALKAMPERPVPLLRLMLNPTPAEIDRQAKELGLSVRAR